MQFYDVINARRSIRKYKDTPVSPETVLRILDAGRKAPSWKNMQCWRYILVSDAALKARLGELLNNPSAGCYRDAPFALVLCALPAESGSEDGKEYYLVDSAISMEHVVLAATAEGLATCWVGLFTEQPVRELLGIPDDVKIVAITPLGYPAQERNPRPRKALEEILFENKWNA